MMRVAVVGRPNVGKSTLVNRLAGRRGSIVGPAEGLTRDKVGTEVSWGGKTFEVDDTGGLVERGGTLSLKVAGQSLRTIEEADVVVMVVDVQIGATAEDEALARRLRRVDRPVVVAANKADGAAGDDAAAEFWSLGLGEPMAVSALHGRGSGELLDRIVDLLPEERSPVDSEVASIAIVGRPNVGKSSIFNAIAGTDRAIVHDEPGTTRDAIDTVVEVGNRTYRFIDTAGLRRRARTAGVNIYGSSRTSRAIERSQIAILVIDAYEGATSQDQRIAEMVEKAGVGAVVALNKWDLVKGEEEAERVERTVSDRMHFLRHAPLIRTSAVTKRGIPQLLDKLESVLEARQIRVATSKLNQLLQEAQQAVPPPRANNRNIRVRYGTQTDVSPPKFILFSNGYVAETWLRYIERRLREEYGFEGNPLRFLVRQRTG